ncbi:tryptophan halogenase family protein [Gilvimarinus chinensis]|uniref:tryptophan halogenase family protein n=1 Tax=Gilvimarinus chinensis TaxID=396005 RepID=UPI000366CFE4|nr:tryptophan halogenase family protein [Gilvimarinus chinensis]
MINRVVVLGGGTAGWMTAAALAKSLSGGPVSITLVESEAIGTVGVGEATIPPIMIYNNALGISEAEFVRATKATFKLGIEFANWKRKGVSYFHPFGMIGSDMDGISFMHYWLRWRKNGGAADFLNFNAEACAAREKKFAWVEEEPGPKMLPDVNYAYHFDAGLYAKFLREFAEARGVQRIEGAVCDVAQNPDSGDITSLTLEGGRRIEGDLFIDCSGFRGLLIEKTYNAGYEDWSHWLPVDSAVAVPSASSGELLPYTRSIAHEAGWQWRIPLQHRVGNGYVYCSKYITDDMARSVLLNNLDGEALAEPRYLRFKTGVRKKSWVNNCIAVGLSAGFLEPLESTSIHLIQRAIHKILAMFPRRTIQPCLVERFNQEMYQEYDEVKDFLIAHYAITERDDSPFWQYVRNMAVPDSLRQKLEVFKERGEVLINKHDMFRETSWFSVLMGQGVEPEGYHPVADTISDEQLRMRMTHIRHAVEKRVSMLPKHGDFVKKHYM